MLKKDDKWIPNGWSTKPIGDIAYIILGQSASSETYNVDRNGLPFYQGKADFGVQYTETRFWCSEPTKIAPKNSILFSVRAPVGDINITKNECCIGRGLSAINGDSVEQSFLYQTLQYVKYSFQILAQGSSFEAINGTDLKESKLLIPPLPEQKKTAPILTSIDTNIEKKQTKLTQTKNLKKSLMADLLTGRARAKL